MSELYNIEAEQSVLGSILLDKDVMEKVTDILEEKDFYKEAHRVIFKSMINLYNNQSEIDLITLADDLRSQGYLDEIGGIGYITSLSSIVPTTDNVKYYANIVKSNSQKRTLWFIFNTGTKGIERGESIDYVMSKFEASTEFLDIDKNEGAENIDTVLNTVINNIEQIQLGNLEEKIKTGISIIDKHTGGLGRGQLITIGAYSGQGKSSLVMQMLKNIIINAKKEDKKTPKVLYITREMTKEEVAQRLILSLCDIGNEKLVKNGLTDKDFKKIADATEIFSNSNLYIDQSSSTIFDIQKQVRIVKPDIVVIDYLQLLQPTDNKLPRERQVAELSRALKNMTLDLNITIIQLTQLAEQATYCRPHGERFTRDSRAIYMDSNIVIYLWEVRGDRNLEEAIKRSERVKEMATPHGASKPEVDTLEEKIVNFKNNGCPFIEIIVDKYRTGTTGSQYYLFEGKTMNYFPIG